MSRKSLSDAERAEKRAADRAYAEQAAEQLRSSDGWQRWLTTRSRFRRYSLTNQLLITHQCPDATRVAGFRAWLNLGYCVRRGEHAIRIWLPMPPTKKEIKAWEKAGADPDTRPRTRFKLGPVFDRSQVEELPPPAKPAPLEAPHQLIEGEQHAALLQPLHAFAESLGCSVVLEDLASPLGGFYEPSTGRIALNRTRSPDAQLHTLIHELAHALVDRAREEQDPELTYASEELVVESVAFTVAGSVGLDTREYSIPYLASWSQRSASITEIHRHATLIDRLAARLEAVLLGLEDPQEDAKGSEEPEPAVLSLSLKAHQLEPEEDSPSPALAGGPLETLRELHRYLYPENYPPEQRPEGARFDWSADTPEVIAEIVRSALTGDHEYRDSPYKASPAVSVPRGTPLA
jgi:antirestriction protein ArdC